MTIGITGYSEEVKRLAASIGSELFQENEGFWTIEPAYIIAYLLNQGCSREEAKRKTLRACFVAS